MDGIILFFVGAASGIAIVTLMNNSKKGREGAKGKLFSLELISSNCQTEISLIPPLPIHQSKQSL